MRKETEIHYNIISGDKEIKTLYFIYAERDSISLGDDIYAPHGKNISFEESDKLSNLLKKLMNDYLNNLHNDCKWKITADNIILGYIIYSPEENSKYELAIPDDLIFNLNIKSIYCSNKGE